MNRTKQEVNKIYTEIDFKISNTFSMSLINLE